jgi:hypothetical protein
LSGIRERYVRTLRDGDPRGEPTRSGHQRLLPGAGAARLLAEEHLPQLEEVLSDGRPAAAMRVFVRLDRELSDAAVDA